MAAEDYTKQCTKCGEIKPAIEFSSDKQKKDGKASHCKVCKRKSYSEYHRRNPEIAKSRDAAWRANNPDRARERRHDYYIANKEDAIEQSRKWREQNACRASENRKKYYYATIEYQRERKAKYLELNGDKIRERARESRKKHRDACNARSRKWAKDNPARHRANCARRRAAQLNATPFWSESEEIAALYEKARAIQKATGHEFHVDHIVPLQSNLVCGLHVLSNLRIIEGYPNRSKGNRHWPDMP